MSKSWIGWVVAITVIVPPHALSYAGDADCHHDEGGCTGSCPFHEFCTILPFTETCYCDFPTGPGGCHGKVMQVVENEEALAASLTNAAGGSELLSVGNGITLTQPAAWVVSVEHSE